MVAPAPVPPLPDASRFTAYAVVAPNVGPFAVSFALYGDGTDYGAWLEVWMGGVQLTAVGDWTLSSPSGSLSALARPITDAVVTLTTPRTGSMYIVGARRPRRLAQFSESRGVTARDENQTYTDIIAMLRETWDNFDRTLQAPFPETLALLVPAAQRANLTAIFDSQGNLTAGAALGNGTVSAAMQPVMNAATLALGRMEFGLFDTRVAITTISVDAAVLWARTAGYTAVGDGGDAIYKQVGANPGAGGVQSANGLWFALVESDPSILQFGASTAAADNYTAFSDAAAYAAAIGRASVFVPAGRFDINMAGKASIDITGGLHGTGFGAVLPPSQTVNGGSIIGVKGTTAAPFAVKSRAVLREFAMLWPDQVNPAAPIVYPAGLSLTDSGSCVFENVKLINPYIGVQCEANCGFLWFRGCAIGAFKQAIRFNQTVAAENWIEGCSFTYGTAYDFYNALGQLAAWQAYYLANSTGIDFRGQHSDAQVIEDNVFVGTNVGIHASYTGGDAYLWATITGNHFDGNFRGLHIENMVRPQSMQITGNTFQSLGQAVANAYSIALAMAGNAVKFDMSLTGNRFSVVGQTHLLLTGDAGQEGTITINGNTFYFAGFGNTPGTYDSTFIGGDTFDVTYTGNICDGATGGRGVYAFKARTVTVTGNCFKTLNDAVKLGTVSKATIIGNTEQNGGSVNGTAPTLKNANNSWN